MLHGLDVRVEVKLSGGDCCICCVEENVGECLGRVENQGVPCCVTPASHCWRVDGPDCRTYPGSQFFVCKVGDGYGVGVCC